MSIKKFWKNIKSKQTIMGAIILALVICVAGTSTMIVPLKADDGPYETQATYDQFTYSKKLTVDHNQVPGDLTGFPILVYNSSDSDLAAHVEQADGGDIAFFGGVDNGTQYNHELEYFDDGTGEIAAWVNVSLTGATDTKLWMFYGNGTIEDQTQTGSGVWNADHFDAVFHMNSTFDSSGNGLDLTNSGVTFDARTGSIAHCGDFVASENDYMYHSTYFDSTHDLAFSSWFLIDSHTGNAQALAYKQNENTDRLEWHVDNATNMSVRTRARDTSESDKMLYNEHCGAGAVGTAFVYAAFSYDEGTLMKNYVNQTMVSVACADIDNGVEEDFTIGMNSQHGNPQQNVDGSIDEFRIYSDVRTDNWFETEYNSYVNKSSGFITYGSESGGEGEEDASVYTIKGLPNDKITWAGVAGTTVYCNETGDTNEWMEINMSINATENVTCIRIFMDDLNDTSAFINATNITCYISSDNVSYGELGTFTDGGSNCSKDINTSNWNAGTMGANPFPLDNPAAWRNTSIFCIFTIDIPVGLATDIFYSSASDSCKVYIGHYT